MGVTRTGDLLKKSVVEELAQPDFDKKFKDEKLVVDLFGSFFADVRRLCMVKNYHALAALLRQRLIGEDITIVIDGKPTIQKAATHDKRKVKIDAAQKRYQTALKAAHDAKRRRPRHYKAIHKARVDAFRFTDEHKIGMKKAFETVGFKVVIAPGEADVYIGSLTGSFVAVSADSDVCFYRNVQRCVRPIRAGHVYKYNLITKESLMLVAKLSSNGLVALAILSGNDYDKNVRGYGINKVKNLLQTFEGGGVRTVEELVELFRKRLHVEQTFANSISIFEYQKEDFVDAAPVSSKEFDECEADLVALNNKKNEQANKKYDTDETERPKVKHRKPYQYQEYPKNKAPPVPPAEVKEAKTVYTTGKSAHKES